MQEDPDHIGLIPRAIVHIFEGKEAEEDDDTLFDVRVSYIEIYNEEIRDLLGEDVTQKLEIKVGANLYLTLSVDILYISYIFYQCKFVNIFDINIFLDI